MYALIEKVLNVKSFAINTFGNCLYNDRERVYKLDSKELIYEHPINLQEIYFKGKFFINDLYGKGIYFDNDIKPCICDYFIHFFKDDFVLFSKRDEEERNTFINKIGTNDYYKIKSASTIYSLYGIYLCRKNFELNSVEVYDFPSATPLWQYDLSSLGKYYDANNKERVVEVKTFIGVIDTSLFIKLNTNEILVLDIQTGILKERLSFIGEMIGESSIARLAKDMPYFQTRYIINEETSLVQALFVDLYYEISHKNGISYTTVHALKNEYEKHGINPQDISKDNFVVGNKLYFLIQDQARFAVLNTDTKLIEYVSEPISITDKPDRFTKLKEIQVSQDKVYVLASDGTLHIFQKENQ